MISLINVANFALFYALPLSTHLSLLRTIVSSSIDVYRWSRPTQQKMKFILIEQISSDEEDGEPMVVLTNGN